MPLRATIMPGGPSFRSPKPPFRRCSLPVSIILFTRIIAMGPTGVRLTGGWLWYISVTTQSFSKNLRMVFKLKQCIKIKGTQPETRSYYNDVHAIVLNPEFHCDQQGKLKKIGLTNLAPRPDPTRTCKCVSLLLWTQFAWINVNYFSSPSFFKKLTRSTFES